MVIGAGKTGIDAVLHLLDSGVDSDNITWIISQDCWYSNRCGPECPPLPRDPFTDNNCGPVITQYVEYQMDCIMASETLMELYHNLEKKGLYFLHTLLGTHQWKAWIGKCLFQSVIVQVI